MIRNWLDIQESNNPIPTVNISMQIKIYGNNKYAQLMWQVYCPKPAYVSKTIPNHGIKVKRKSIPTNKHFATGNMYFGI